MNADELVRVLSQGDIHGLLLRVGDLWLATYKPRSRFAVLIVDEGSDETPQSRVTFPRAAACGEATSQCPVDPRNPVPAERP